MPNWELKHCCKHEQIVFLATLGVCAVVILALWRTVLLLPFKLITVFIHEASHAIACKLTCGHVEGIQVHANEGGTTQTSGGVYWFILPAGLDTPGPLYRVCSLPCCCMDSARNNKDKNSAVHHFVHWCDEQLIFCL
ncbi:hypothetical protein AABB24_027213 [Solanum stoloniferum]|uniref:Uncharacterized protein n=1 Tax=Solanum stoloniferum TaxID=62892 RepID=A0ABD2SI76_9SOLN